jgi:hypothetical protein
MARLSHVARSLARFSVWPYPKRVRFQVLTATGMKMAVIWDVEPCGLVEIDDVSEVLSAIFISKNVVNKCDCCCYYCYGVRLCLVELGL